MYEGKRPACDMTTGEFWTYPKYVELACPEQATAHMPDGCERFRFVTLRIPEDEFDAMEDGKLNRMPERSEVAGSSGYFYVDCVPLTAAQAVGRRGRQSGLRVARRSIGCWSEGVQVELGKRTALLSSAGRMFTIDPGVDVIHSTRDPLETEFRTVA